MKDQSSDEEYKWGSGGEYGDGWGPNFGERDGSEDCDQSENKSYTSKSSIFDAFETLGLDPNNELTQNQLTT